MKIHWVLPMVLMLAACGQFKAWSDPVPAAVIRVTGYGAINEQARLSLPQRRLNAMNASRLDAYRVLAERLYGTLLSGNSTVKDMALQDNTLRAYLDAKVQGARVLSVNERADGSYETVIEYVLTDEFKEDARRVHLSQAAASRNSMEPEAVNSTSPSAGVQLYQMR